MLNGSKNISDTRKLTIVTPSAVVHMTHAIPLLYCRLREIQMSEYDAENYESFSNSVRRQVQSLRVILDSLQVYTDTS